MLHNQCLKLLAVSVGAMGLGSIPRSSAGSSADVYLFPYFQNNGNSRTQAEFLCNAKQV